MSSAKLVTCLLALAATLAATGTPRTCPEHWVACSTGRCVPPNWVCNGRNECPGGEDEQHCGTPRTCPEHWVACSTGLCVPPDLVCNDFNSCPGGEDEQHCGTPRTCPEHYVACSTGRCMPPDSVCNVIKSCPGGEDELHCGTPRTCPEHWAACSTGRCLPPNWVCDGHKSCPGGEDEQHCGAPRTCPEHWGACSTGRCMAPERVCNGIKDCPGGEDEQHCGSLLNATTTASTTTTGTPRTCPEHWVACSTGRCVPPNWVCNGRNECPGGEDEQHCGTPRTCPEHWVACSTGLCVPPDLVCNDFNSCPGGEDEQHCGTPRTCPEHYVACSTGRCMPPDSVCNVIKSCPGGEDELHCGTPRTCPEHWAACSTGRCLPPNWVCDGRKSCPGGEDEQHCGAPRTCPEHWGACSTGRCMAPERVCNGIKDCPGGEDEQHCGSLLNATTTASTTTTESSKDQCIVPLQPEGGYFTIEDGAAQQPGVHVADLHLYFTCDSGYRLIGSQTVMCHQGTWTSEIPTCQRLCRLNPHVSVDYECMIVEGGVNIRSQACGLFEPQGTVVQPRCRSPNYYHPGMLRNMHCIDGNWDYVAVCEPECGKVTPDGVSLQIGGRSAKLGELPWHAGIYDKQMTPYLQVCGGSLVSATMVISAAHCFWNEASTSPYPASKYAVALGKIYRPWNNPHDTSNQQFDVKEIKLTPRFRGSMTLFQEDLALVLLSRPAVYQNNVRPVCVDFDANFDRTQLDSGKKGKIAGWGLTDPSGHPSPVLRVLELPTVSITECFSKSPDSFVQYISSDKFCAGYWNGSKALCRGDSGGGLAFAQPERGSDRYYLRGVVSTAASANGQCNAQTVATFTQISRHEHFIKEYLLL